MASFLYGSDELYSFIDHNPDVLMKDIKYVNNPYVIAQNPNVRPSTPLLRWILRPDLR